MNAWCCIQLPVGLSESEIVALDFDLPIIGARAEIVERILQVFPHADPAAGAVFRRDINEPPRVERPDLLAVLVTERDYTLIIKLMGDREWCNALVVVAWGEDIAIDAFRKLLEEFNLLAFESESGEVLNFNDDPQKWMRAGRAERERRVLEMYKDA